MEEGMSKRICSPEYRGSNQIIRGMDRILVRTKQDMVELCQGCDGREECQEQINSFSHLERFKERFF